MHLDSNKVKGVDISTGSLGHGLPMAVGLALGARVQGRKWQTYCILGDGEMNEGSNWEALMSAAHFKLDNLTVIVDVVAFPLRMISVVLYVVVVATYLVVFFLALRGMAAFAGRTALQLAFDLFRVDFQPGRTARPARLCFRGRQQSCSGS